MTNYLSDIWWGLVTGFNKLKIKFKELLCMLVTTVFIFRYSRRVIGGNAGFWIPMY